MSIRLNFLKDKGNNLKKRNVFELFFSINAILTKMGENRYLFGVFGSRYWVQGTRSLVLGILYSVLGTWYWVLRYLCDRFGCPKRQARDQGALVNQLISKLTNRDYAIHL